MSDVASSDSIGGNDAVASLALASAGAAMSPRTAGGGAGSRFRATAERLRRDQRARKPSSALMVFSEWRRAPRQDFGIGAVALALGKGRRGGVLGDEPGDVVAYRFRHRDGLDDRLSRLGQGF